MSDKGFTRYLKKIPAIFLYSALEVGLCLAGVGAAGLIFGVPGPLLWRADTGSLIAAGLLSLPALLFAATVVSSWGLSWRALRAVFESLRDSPIGDFIRENRWPSFLALSMVAGICEETLFRGVLQPRTGLIIASLVFGLFHALSITYFILASVIGLYLGWVYDWTGGNLLVPALIHAAYDFMILRLYKRKLAADEFPTDAAENEG